MALGDRVDLGQGRQQPLAHEPRAHGCDRSVHRVQQGALAAFTALGHDQLEARARGVVQDQVVRGLDLLDVPHVVAVRALGLFQVFDQSARRRHHRRLVGEAIALQRLDLEVPLESAPHAVAIKAPVVALGDALAQTATQLDAVLPTIFQGHRPQQFRRANPRQLVVDLVGRKLGRREAARGDVDPGESRLGRTLARGDEHAGQVVALLRFESVLFRQRSRRHNAHDATVHNALHMARILQLLADRHLEALAHQPDQVVLRRFDRNARHGHRVRTLVAGRQGQADLAGRDHCVLAKHLVKVAHAEEEQSTRRVLLRLVELLHHGRHTALLLGLLGGLLFLGRCRSGRRFPTPGHRRSLGHTVLVFTLPHRVRLSLFHRAPIQKVFLIHSPVVRRSAPSPGR